jgi:hypothetical protein
VAGLFDGSMAMLQQCDKTRPIESRAFVTSLPKLFGEHYRVPIA